MLIPLTATKPDNGIAPDEITTQTLHFWVRSDLGVSDTGGAVDSWADQSGNGNNLTGSGAARPTIQSAALNGFDGIRFDGTDDVLTTGTITPLDTDEIHTFMVGKTVSWTNNDYLLLLNNSSQRQVRHQGTTPEIRQSGDVANVNPVSPAIGDFWLIQSGFKATTASFQVLNDGTKVTGGDEGSHFQLDRVSLGASATPSNFGNVEVVEVAIFSSEITDATELAGLLTYFNKRYALW